MIVSDLTLMTRQRERDRDRDRQRETETKRETEKDRQREREREREIILPIQLFSTYHIDKVYIFSLLEFLTTKAPSLPYDIIKTYLNMLLW